ncbi:MAG: hypothetical protein DRJ51_01580 [Thermoprotei archaeon]|nr:MAG: hypothetical protein DRJ51_01580 [Thermoprotei archaeon]
MLVMARLLRISHFNDDIPYRDYEKLRLTVISILVDLIRRSRGTCITFTGKKIAILAGLSPQPVLLTVVKSILEELRRERLISRYSRSSHGIKYIITRDSPLWQVVKSGDFEKYTCLFNETLCVIISDLVKKRSES